MECRAGSRLVFVVAMSGDLPSVLVLMLVIMIMLVGCGVGISAATPLPVRVSATAPPYERLKAARQLLQQSPLIDG